MMEYTFLATAPFGLEAIVARELEELGFHDRTVENGRVYFKADPLGALRCNLWLRTADRVMWVVGQFQAETFDELFEGTKALPWSDWLPRGARFPIEGRSVKSQLSSVPACQSIVKKAIATKLTETYRDSWLEETGPTFSVEVSLLKDQVTLAIDTSGQGLHKRGYRVETGPAPIKETLAAALVLLSRWKAHRPFSDPMCGSGTIAIEAAWIGAGIAPGLLRSFSMESFGWLSTQEIHDIRDEAEAVKEHIPPMNITATDIDAHATALTTQHALLAGVGKYIQVAQQPLRQFSPVDPYGCLVSNPPYGERMGEDREVRMLYRQLGEIMRKQETWSTFILTSHEEFERLYGKRAEKNRKLYNGRIECHFYQYLGPLPPRPKKESEQQAHLA